MARKPKKQTSKKKSLSNDWLRWVLVVVPVVGLLFLASHNWISDKTKRIYYGHAARTAFSTELRTLRGPLDVLGFKGVTGEKSKCLMEPVYGYDAAQLQCSTYHQNYVVVGNDAATKASFVTSAKELDELLAKDKWTTTSNAAPNLYEWFSGIASGKDWYPDIDSVKNDGNKHCSLTFNVAYSNPNPPAFEIRIGCNAPSLEKLKDFVQF